MLAWGSQVVVLSAWGRPLVVGCVRFGPVWVAGAVWWQVWRWLVAFRSGGRVPWGQRGSAVVCFDLGRLLAGGEAVVRLVPEGGVICCAKFGVEGDVLGGVDFHPACGGVPSEFTVIGGWVPNTIFGEEQGTATVADGGIIGTTKR